MRDDDLLPGAPLVGEYLAANHILSEVENLFALGCGYNLDGRTVLVRHDGLAVAANDIVHGIVGHRHAAPRAVVEARLVPSVLDQTRVDGLAVIYGRVYDLTRRALPRVVRSDDLTRTVTVCNYDLRYGRHLVVGIDLVLAARPPQKAQIPAAPQSQAEGIGTLLQHAGHVVGLILQTLVIRGPAGSIMRIAHLDAVDGRLVHAVRGDVGNGRSHGLRQRELLAQHGRGIGLLGRQDPLGLPLVGRHHARKPRAALAPLRDPPAVVPYTHLPLVTRTRGQRLTLVCHRHAVLRLDAPRTPHTAAVTEDSHLVCLLHDITVGALHNPAQHGLRIHYARRLTHMVHLQRRHAHLRRRRQPRRRE